MPENESTIPPATPVKTYDFRIVAYLDPHVSKALKNDHEVKNKGAKTSISEMVNEIIAKHYGLKVR